MRRADHSFRGILPGVSNVCVVETAKRGSLGSIWALGPQKERRFWLRLKYMYVKFVFFVLAHTTLFEHVSARPHLSLPSVGYI